MKIDLSNKRAVITGSTVGIGFAIAYGLCKRRRERSPQWAQSSDRG